MSLESPGGSINYGKAPQKKESKKTSRYTETFSFQAPSHTTSPPTTHTVFFHFVVYACLLPYLARGLAHTSSSWLHFQFVVKSIIQIHFICIFLLKKGPWWAYYYSLSISSINFKSPLCPLCSPHTDAASSHTSLPHRQFMKLHS